MPFPYRVPFAQACGVFWTLYLSILNSEEDEMQDRQTALHKALARDERIAHEQLVVRSES